MYIDIMPTGGYMKKFNVGALAVFSLIAAAMGTFMGLIWIVRL